MSLFSYFSFLVAVDLLWTLLIVGGGFYYCTGVHRFPALIQTFSTHLAQGLASVERYAGLKESGVELSKCPVFIITDFYDFMYFTYFLCLRSRSRVAESPKPVEERAMGMTLCGGCGLVSCRCGSSEAPMVGCDHPAHFFNEVTLSIDCALCGTVMLHAMDPHELAAQARRAGRRQRVLLGELGMVTS